MLKQHLHIQLAKNFWYMLAAAEPYLLLVMARLEKIQK
jgi:hypothetical protein